jgi:hypothetical protein
MAMRRAPLVAVALVFALPGCGGGSSKPLTKEEYASKADVICGKYSDQTKALATPKNLADLATIADKTLPILDHAIKDLTKLQPPASEKALADQWIAQVTNLKDDLQQIRDKAQAGDIAGVQAVVPRATNDNSRSNQLATQLGMSVCNKD